MPYKNLSKNAFSLKNLKLNIIQAVGRTFLCTEYTVFKITIIEIVDFKMNWLCYGSLLNHFILGLCIRKKNFNPQTNFLLLVWRQMLNNSKMGKHIHHLRTCFLKDEGQLKYMAKLNISKVRKQALGKINSLVLRETH